MKYFPILLSKAGELKALKELNKAIVPDISPIIEILDGNLSAVEATLLSHWAFNGNQILIDFANYSNVTRDIGGITTFFANLFSAGINIVPVIQQNSQNSLLGLIANLVSSNNCNVCIRASNSDGGFINYTANLNTLIGQIGVNPSDTMLLIDLGYAQAHNYNNLAALAISILNSIQNPQQWNNIIVASGSFPSDLSHLSASNNVQRINRYEWHIWNAINSIPTLRGIVKYGDYGNKNPEYGGESPYPGSCSIKYTALDEFIIYRGQLSQDHPDGNGQYITFAARLIRIPEYSGSAFSWGDFNINRIAHQTVGASGTKPGNAKTWVEMTQNHHITFLHSLL